MVAGYTFPATQSHVDKGFKDEITSDLKREYPLFLGKIQRRFFRRLYGSLGRDGADSGCSQGNCTECRILWTFSTAYRMYGDTATAVNWLTGAQRYFMNHFDMIRSIGRRILVIKADGTPLDTNKQTLRKRSYAIYGLSEHFEATTNNESLQKYRGFIG